jgi:hypothetical protein
VVRYRLIINPVSHISLLKLTSLQPFHNVLFSASSFAPSSVPGVPPPKDTPPKTLPKGKVIPTLPTSIYTFPSFQYITLPAVPDADTYNRLLRQFIRGYVLPLSIDAEFAKMDPDSAKMLTRDLNARWDIPYSTPINEAMILVCGHGNRDMRCGVMGPLLHAEFEEKLPTFDVDLVTEPSAFEKKEKWATPKKDAEVAAERRNAEGEEESTGSDDKPSRPEAPISRKSRLGARVGQISHIGGHKFAGNVIVYIPNTPQWKSHPLSGKGIWYGRVEPWHVEGIIEQTIRRGVIIKELFRGGISRAGNRIRLE